MFEKCTRLDNPTMPDLPSGTAASREEATMEEDIFSDNVPDAGDVGGKENDLSSNDEGDKEEMLDLKKMFSANELKKSKPTMCSHCETNECELVAYSKWSLQSGWQSMVIVP